MRRVIALLMLLMLPLHFTWVAASPYCQHESGRASWHFGHHFHVHKGEHQGVHEGNGAHGQEASQPDGDGAAGGHQGSAKKVALDADCTVCHLGAAQFPLVTELAFAARALGDLVAAPTRHLSSVHLPGPDRPNWRRLVPSR